MYLDNNSINRFFVYIFFNKSFLKINIKLLQKSQNKKIQNYQSTQALSNIRKLQFLSRVKQNQDISYCLTFILKKISSVSKKSELLRQVV